MTDKQKELVKELFDYGCRDGFKDYQYRAFLKMPERIEELQLLRRSLDARDKADLHYVCSVAVTVRGAESLLLRKNRDRDVSEYHAPVYDIPQSALRERPVVVGLLTTWPLKYMVEEPPPSRL